jgi:hypothetical protein
MYAIIFQTYDSDSAIRSIHHSGATHATPPQQTYLDLNPGPELRNARR